MNKTKKIASRVKVMTTTNMKLHSCTNIFPLNAKNVSFYVSMQCFWRMFWKGTEKTNIEMLIGLLESFESHAEIIAKRKQTNKKGNFWDNFDKWLCAVTQSPEIVLEKWLMNWKWLRWKFEESQKEFCARN